MSGFTPEAVRDTLIAAGFTESSAPGTEGFGLGDGRENHGEITISWYSGGQEWASLESMWAARAAQYGAYREALAGAGYWVSMDGGYVIVTGVVRTERT